MALPHEFVPDGIFDFDLPRVVSRALTARIFRFKLDLADLIVRALELAVTAGHGMAIFDAILKYADIRFAALAVTGDDEIVLGDKSDTRHAYYDRKSKLIDKIYECCICRGYVDYEGS